MPLSSICILGFKGASTSQVIGTRNEVMMDDYDGQMIFGDLVGLKLPDIHPTGEEKPRKTSPRKLVPSGDRTRARCVTSVHATTCSTAVDATVNLSTRTSTLPWGVPTEAFWPNVSTVGKNLKPWDIFLENVWPGKAWWSTEQWGGQKIAYEATIKGNSVNHEESFTIGKKTLKPHSVLKDKIYIGQTKRNLITRIKEHF